MLKAYMHGNLLGVCPNSRLNFECNQLLFVVSFYFQCTNDLYIVKMRSLKQIQSWFYIFRLITCTKLSYKLNMYEHIHVYEHIESCPTIIRNKQLWDGNTIIFLAPIKKAEKYIILSFNISLIFNSVFGIPVNVSYECITTQLDLSQNVFGVCLPRM